MGRRWWWWWWTREGRVDGRNHRRGRSHSHMVDDERAWCYLPPLVPLLSLLLKKGLKIERHALSHSTQWFVLLSSAAFASPPCRSKVAALH